MAYQINTHLTLKISHPTQHEFLTLNNYQLYLTKPNLILKYIFTFSFCRATRNHNFKARSVSEIWFRTLNENIHTYLSLSYFIEIWDVSEIQNATVHNLYLSIQLFTCLSICFRAVFLSTHLSFGLSSIFNCLYVSPSVFFSVLSSIYLQYPR